MKMLRHLLTTLGLLFIVKTHGLIVRKPGCVEDACSELYEHLDGNFCPGANWAPPDTELEPYGLVGPYDVVLPPKGTTTEPYVGCDRPTDPNYYKNKIVLVERGDCHFYDKVLSAKNGGAVGVIVGDDKLEDLIPMGAPFGQTADIPCMFVGYTTWEKVSEMVRMDTKNETTTAIMSVDGSMSEDNPIKIAGYLLIVLPAVWCALVALLMLRRCWRARAARAQRIERTRHLAVVNYSPASEDSSPSPDGKERPLIPASPGTRQFNTSCPICIEDYTRGDSVKQLPCGHIFHPPCIDQWLQLQDTCPICKRSIFDVPDGYRGQQQTWCERHCRLCVNNCACCCTFCIRRPPEQDAAYQSLSSSPINSTGIRRGSNSPIAMSSEHHSDDPEPPEYRPVQIAIKEDNSGQPERGLAAPS